MSTLIEPRSSLLAQAVWPIAALCAPCLLRRQLFRRQLLRKYSLREPSLLRNSSASQTRRCAPVSVPHTLFPCPSLLSPRETRIVVQGQWAAHGYSYGTCTTPQYFTLGCSRRESRHLVSMLCAYPLLPLLLHCCGPLMISDH